MDTLVIVWVLCGVGGYLIGSFSPALAISNFIGKKDIRKYGSGNAGATNILRAYGWKASLIVLLIDAAKGLLVVLLSKLFGGEIGAMIGSICVVTGHNWPYVFGFRGGKGVSTTMGVLFALMPAVTAGILAIAVIIIAITRIVSAGAVVGILSAVIASFVFYPGKIFLQIPVIVLAIFLLFVHRDNIKRMIRKEERQISFKKNSASG